MRGPGIEIEPIRNHSWRQFDGTRMRNSSSLGLSREWRNPSIKLRKKKLKSCGPLSKSAMFKAFQETLEDSKITISPGWQEHSWNIRLHGLIKYHLVEVTILKEVDFPRWAIAGSRKSKKVA